MVDEAFAIFGRDAGQGLLPRFLGKYPHAVENRLHLLFQVQPPGPAVLGVGPPGSPVSAK